MWKFTIGYLCGAASVAIYGKEIRKGLHRLADMIP